MPYIPRKPAQLRIAQLVLSNGFGGTEQHVALLSHELSTLGARVRLVCGDQNTRLIDDLHGTGVEVCGLRLNKSNLPARWDEAYRTIIGWNPHVIHAHLGSSLLCGASLTLPKQRLVFTQHFITPAYRETTGLHSKARALMHRLVHKRVAYAFAATDLVRNEMVQSEGFRQDKITVIPLGINIEGVAEQACSASTVCAEFCLPNDAILLVTPARLEQVKGHETLLAALPFVLARYPNTHLLLAGIGALEQRLRRQSRDLGIGDHVHFLGQRTDVPRLLAQAALCVLPSYEDSFGLVLVEAMAVGTPVVACDIGGPREIVTQAETGLLVPPQDPAAMAQAIMI